MAEENDNFTGLSEDEAKEFHGLYLQGMAVFVGIAVVAHILVWAWRPWIPADEGYTLLEGGKQLASNLLTTLT